MTTGKRILAALCAVLAVLWAAASAAQDRVTPETFLDFANQRTLTFSDYPSGGLVGVEHFLSRTHSVWQRSDGSCTHGQVYVDEGRLCFLYEDDMEHGPHCWYVFAYNDTFLVRSSDQLFGASMQTITGVDDEPLACLGVPLS